MATRSERIAIVKENNRKIIIDSILEESRNVEGKLNDDITYRQLVTINKRLINIAVFKKQKLSEEALEKKKQAGKKRYRENKEYYIEKRKEARIGYSK